jgi:beta-glucan synthesis-associated protein KRE6
MVGVSHPFARSLADLPSPDFMEVFDYSITQINEYHGGPIQQAISGLSNLNNQWYDGNGYQTYAFEYKPGADGESTFFVGDTATWRLTGDAIGPNGNVGQRVLPEEPMYPIVNFGMSDGFSALNLTGIAPLLPSTMRVDHIRIYQDPSAESVTCDPPGYETTPYIKQHYDVYTNPNLTQW